MCRVALDRRKIHSTALACTARGALALRGPRGAGQRRLFSSSLGSYEARSSHAIYRIAVWIARVLHGLWCSSLVPAV